MLDTASRSSLTEFISKKVPLQQQNVSLLLRKHVFKDKKKPTSVSEADREILSHGYTDNPGNEVYRVSGIIR